MINDLQNSYLRIIAGKLKGLHVDAPKGGKTVRPISDRVKEALFDIMASKLPKAYVLDMFSGTGAIGFEAISRGAAKVVYMEHDRRNVQLIVANAQRLGVQDQISIIPGELPQTVKKVRGQFDVIFMDPPFALEIAQDIFPILKQRKLCKPHTTIVLQRDRRSPEILSDDFILARKHKIGDSIVYFYQLPDQPPAQDDDSS